MTPFLILVSVIAVIQMVTAVVERIFNLRMEGKLAITSNSEYMWHVLRLPVEFYSQRQTGDIAMRKQTNATIASTMINTFTPLILNVGMMIFYLVVMLRYNVILSMVGIASILINSTLSRFISNKKINVSRVRLRDAAKLQSTTVSGIEMIETIKASGVEDAFFAKWAGYQASVNRQDMKNQHITQYYGLLLGFVTVLSNDIILALGLLFTMFGDGSIGMVFGFQTLLNSFTAPVTQLTSARDLIREMRTDMERIEDVLEYPTDVSPDSLKLNEEISYAKLSGRVEMKNVTFG